MNLTSHYRIIRHAVKENLPGARAVTGCVSLRGEDRMALEVANPRRWESGPKAGVKGDGMAKETIGFIAPPTLRACLTALPKDRLQAAVAHCRGERGSTGTVAQVREKAGR